MATNAYGQNYSGNDDFRGWLAVNSPNFLSFAGNDGQADMNKALQFYSSQGLSSREAAMRANAAVSNTQALYGDWSAARQGAAQTGQKATVSGGGSATPAVDPAMLAYYDDQERKARDGLGRLGNQKNIGMDNIANSFMEALNALSGQKATADRDLGLNRENTTTDNRNTRAAIDRNVSNSSAGIQRVLGSIGAGRSSAASVLAPFAVARQGTAQQRTAQDQFGRNMQTLDLQGEDLNRQFEENRTGLESNKKQKERELQSSLAQQEAGINESLSNISLQRAQAKGQNYAQARGVMTPFTDRINQLLTQIDNFGRQYQGAVQNNANIKYEAKPLESYDRENISVSANNGNDPVRQVTNSYYNLLTNAAKKKKDQSY